MREQAGDLLIAECGYWIADLKDGGPRVASEAMRGRRRGVSSEASREGGGHSFTLECQCEGKGLTPLAAGLAAGGRFSSEVVLRMLCVAAQEIRPPAGLLRSSQSEGRVPPRPEGSSFDSLTLLSFLEVLVPVNGAPGGQYRRTLSRAATHLLRPIGSANQLHLKPSNACDRGESPVYRRDQESAEPAVLTKDEKHQPGDKGHESQCEQIPMRP